jgi:hypothetical protein
MLALMAGRNVGETMRLVQDGQECVDRVTRSSIF